MKTSITELNSTELHAVSGGQEQTNSTALATTQAQSYQNNCFFLLKASAILIDLGINFQIELNEAMYQIRLGEYSGPDIMMSLVKKFMILTAGYFIAPQFFFLL